MNGPRHPKPQEVASLGELLDKTFRGKQVEAGEKGVMLREYPQLVNEDNLDHLWVHEDGGRIVSHVGVFPRDMSIEGCRTGSAAIGAVATYPEYRGQGLASQLMTAAIDHAIAEGRPVMPISGGRGLYTRIGAVDCPRVIKCAVSRQVAAALADASVTVRNATAADLPAIARLYRNEPVRYLRLPIDYERAFKIQFVQNCDCLFKLICRGGEPCAYVVIQSHFYGKEPNLWACEAGGDKHAVLGALDALLKSDPCERLGCQNLGLFLAASDTGACARLKAAGVAGQCESYGTVLLTDPARLLKDLDAYQAERLGSRRLDLSISGETATFRVKDATWTCPAVAVSRVLLGSVSNDPPAPKPESGAVADALAALTPIRIPHYGLSYV